MASCANSIANKVGPLVDALRVAAQAAPPGPVQAKLFTLAKRLATSTADLVRVGRDVAANPSSALSPQLSACLATVSETMSQMSQALSEGAPRILLRPLPLSPLTLPPARAAAAHRPLQYLPLSVGYLGYSSRAQRAWTRRPDGRIRSRRSRPCIRSSTTRPSWPRRASSCRVRHPAGRMDHSDSPCTRLITR